MRHFFEPVAAGKRILFLFDDPNGKYDNIFDGYRIILEPALFIATEQRIHLMPDWYCIFDYNYEGAETWWGRDPETGKRQMKAWDADYVMIYTLPDQLEETRREWTAHGFHEISALSWGDLEERTAPRSTITPLRPTRWKALS